jgi:hypothetical protein
MGLFDWFKRKSSSPSYPELLRPREANTAFFEIIQDVFRQQGRPFEIDFETASIESEGRVYGLTNLAQICAQHATMEWPDKINEHFNAMEQVFQRATAAPDEPTTWEDAEDSLALLVYHRGSLPTDFVDDITVWIDLPEVVTALVLDTDQSTSTISKKDSQQWEVLLDQIKRRALENTKDLADCSIESIPIDAEASLYSVVSDQPYGASSIYWLDEIPNLVGPFGTFVGIPTRFQLFAIPIDQKLTALVHVLGMFSVVEQTFHAGPRSISPTILYRSPDGEFEEVTLNRNGDELTLQMPRLLAACLSPPSD